MIIVDNVIIVTLFAYTSISRQKTRAKKEGESSGHARLQAEKTKDQGRAREGESAQIWSA